MIFAFQTLCHLFIWMTYSLLYLYVHQPQCPALLAKNWPASIFLGDCHYTVLFEMIVRVLTTCHTQNTWHTSVCFFLFNRTTLHVFVTYLTGAPYVHPSWFYKQHDNRVRSKLYVACQRWSFQWRFWFVPSVPGYVRYVTKSWYVIVLHKKHIYCYLKCIVYDKLLNPRESFRITQYFTHLQQFVMLCLLVLVYLYA